MSDHSGQADTKLVVVNCRFENNAVVKRDSCWGCTFGGAGIFTSGPSVYLINSYFASNHVYPEDNNAPNGMSLVPESGWGGDVMIETWSGKLVLLGTTISEIYLQDGSSTGLSSGMSCPDPQVHCSGY